MNARELIGTVTISICALALTAAVIYQAVRIGVKPDAELLGLLGLLLGAFLRAPGSTERVEIRQSPDNPVPTAEVP